jgi:hypothetical protein
MPDKNKKQLLGIRVQAIQVAQVVEDAKHFRKSKDGIVQIALYNLFLLKKEERAHLYARLPKKIFGRPIL